MPKKAPNLIYATDIAITDGNFTPTNAMAVLRRYHQHVKCEPFRMLHFVGTWDILYHQSLRLDQTLQDLGKAVVQSELVVVSVWRIPFMFDCPLMR